MTGKHQFWNIAASLIAIVVLVSSAGRLKAYLLPAQSETSLSEPAPSGAHTEPGEPHAAASEQHGGGEGGGRNPVFVWINFLLVFGALWYLSKKFLGPYLERRGEAIREDMRKSSQALQEASERLGVVEQKLLKLDEEIASLRNSALQEAAAERARIETAAQADAAKIAQAAEQEIAAAAKLARQELKTYAAELAVELAEKRIRESISGESDRSIFRSFIEDLGDGPARRDNGRRKGGGD